MQVERRIRGCVVEVAPAGYAEGLYMGADRKREVKEKLRRLSN